MHRGCTGHAHRSISDGRLRRSSNETPAAPHVKRAGANKPMRNNGPDSTRAVSAAALPYLQGRPRSTHGPAHRILQCRCVGYGCRPCHPQTLALPQCVTGPGRRGAGRRPSAQAGSHGGWCHPGPAGRNHCACVVNVVRDAGITRLDRQVKIWV